MKRKAFYKRAAASFLALSLAAGHSAAFAACKNSEMVRIEGWNDETQTAVLGSCYETEDLVAKDENGKEYDVSVNVYHKTNGNEVPLIYGKFDKALGKITDEQYDVFADSYITEQKNLKTKIAEIEMRLSEVKTESDNLTNFISLMKKYTEFKELTQEILYSFVDRIEIGEKEKFSHNTQKIKIIYNFIGAVDIPQE